MGKYDEVSVLRILNQNPDIKAGRLPSGVGVVEVVKDSTNIGNSTHGKIDFLTKYCGYSLFFVSKPVKQNVAKTTKKEKKKQYEENKALKEEVLKKKNKNAKRRE